MKNEIEIWYKKKLKEGISKLDLLDALRQNNYSESQLQVLSNQMDLYIDEISNMTHDIEHIESDILLSKKLQMEADLSSWYQIKLRQGYNKDHLIEELKKQGYDDEMVKRITR